MVLEVAITFWQKRVILWPASAMLTGNGIAFILRVPGTHHGDWWSFHGVWIYVAVAAVSLLSKYLIRFRGRHIFNPSNFGLVLFFLLLGSRHVMTFRATRITVGVAAFFLRSFNLWCCWSPLRFGRDASFGACYDASCSEFGGD